MLNPGLASKKGKVEEKKKPVGFMQQEQNFFNNADVLRTGIRAVETVDVNSHADFPTLGSMPAVVESAQASKRGKKKQNSRVVTAA